MVKKYFAYIILIVLIAVAVWFFVNKTNKLPETSDINSLVNEIPSVTPSAKMTDQSNGWIRLENGLEYLDLTVGSGQEAKNGDKVFAHYAGTLENGTKFDNSYDRGEPFSFVLGGGMVIKGWDLGLLGMKIGGKRKLVISPELGYGSRDIGNGLIPPDSTLYFDVELVDIQTSKGQ